MIIDYLVLYKTHKYEIVHHLLGQENNSIVKNILYGMILKCFYHIGKVHLKTLDSSIYILDRPFHHRHLLIEYHEDVCRHSL